MNRNKKDVDKYVENLQSKLSTKEFKTRAYSVARLYFDVGEYVNCQKYVEIYLTQKDNNAAAYKLYGQTLQKLGQKEMALEQYKTSHDIDPTQTSTILDICELLADDDLSIEAGRALYWCEKAEATFPRHPITFRLRERLTILSNPDPEALVNLLKAEMAARPKDVSLHARLLKHYLNINKSIEAFDHSFNIEFNNDNFMNNYAWYEVLDELLKHNSEKTDASWLHQLLLLTVRERLCVLSMAETQTGPSKSLVECNELLYAYDQALETVAKARAPPGFAEFHASLLQHHRGQFAFHAATLLLKRAKKDQLIWSCANKVAAPLMMIAWQTGPLDSNANWLRHAPEKMRNAVSRWYTEGSYRCSQSGHYLISNFQDKSQSFLDQVSQCCSGPHWKDKLYAILFTNRNHLANIKTSHFVSNAFNAPMFRLPRKNEVEAYDDDALRQNGNSLHHFVWILLNYKNFAHFKCTLFDMLTPTTSSCGPESLNKLDIQAFLYCTALTTRQQKANIDVSYVVSDKPNTLPANITDLLCSPSQMKWWDCAYKFSQNLLGTELTDIRATLSRGIEVVRCIDYHGLDAELLCILGRIFSERSKTTTSVEEKTFLELRACLYYRSAIPLLEKLKSRVMVKVSDKRMFDYTHSELDTRELNKLLEESKLYVAINHLNDCEYEKVIENLLNVKSGQAYYYLAHTYRKIAQQENNSSPDFSKFKTAALLANAKNYAYKALDILKDTDGNKNNPLYIDTQEMIEDIEIQINKIEQDVSNTTNDVGGSSDENLSFRSEAMRNNRLFRNLSSTPKGPSKCNVTNYKTAMDSQTLELTRIDSQHLERIEQEICKLHKKDTTISDFMSETKDWFDENRRLGNLIMTTINTNIQNTTEQFNQLKISVDQVKNQVNECKNECKDVGELKKEIEELKKEVDKLKKSEQPIDQSELYNLEAEYRPNDNAANYAAAPLPFPAQMLPQFNQRPPFPVPPNPYQMYNPTLYNLYTQYSQFAQPNSVPGAPPLFDASRGQIGYPGMYPTPDQMYLDVAHLIPPAVPTIPAPVAVPTVSTIPAVPAPTLPTIPPKSNVTLPTSANITKTMNFTESNEAARALPVNVVITSSDPLPTSASAPAPVLSVTIPPKHIKGTPHNYQIAMPTSSEAKIMSPPVFSFSMPDNSKTQPTSTYNWKQAFQSFHTEESPLNKALQGESSLDNSNTVVDGPFKGASSNISLNKSRTLSEKSNTSVDYDPCPDFKPIVPLPAEVKLMTGEEDEESIFSARAKLFRFTDKQWKERGIGEIKLLKHKGTGKVRVLMRREQVHKICTNHIITSDMKIEPMKNETKAYFWVAHDFSEERIVLEKFSIRFKTADIAKDFYDTFEKARQEAKSLAVAVNAENKNMSSVNKTKDKSGTQQFIQNEANALVKETVPITSTQSKTVVGGFTFSSTPVFKSVESNAKSNEPTTDLGNKINLFSGLTFKTSSSSPFSNIFTAAATAATSDANTEKQDVKKNQLNTSDTAEEFEPSVEFEPVIPLPALVDQKTGEEDEQILFEHRAKLLRFDSNTKEWKERGLGNIKLLAHKNNNQKIRLLMRREQIMKVCCNHAVTKELTFQKMPNVDKAITWCAKDFSEGELVPETFCLRFKTVKVCDDFIEAIKSAQSKLKDDSKAAKEEQNAAKQISQSGFGDKFKAKPGSWQCESCYTNNLESFAKCACCEQPKPATSKVAASDKTATSSTSWGDKFKPKPGSWECQSCFVRNEVNLDKCSACNSAKNPAAVNIAKENKEISVKFSFGISSQKTTSVLGQPKKESSGSGFGDKFKPKEGTWECKQCFIRNEATADNCVACSSPKDPNAPKKSTNIFDTSATAVKFRFGIPPTSTNDEKTKKVEPASIFDGTGSHNFTFGIPSTTTIEQKPTGVIFAAPKVSDVAVTLNFGLSEELTKAPAVKPSVKPALLPTPKTDANSFANKENGEFGFVFKSAVSASSPVKSPNKSQVDESDGEDYAKEEDCHIHFNPVIPMPEKVDVVTGEENEAELYSHRARLYRFASGEWKERGTGIVKILKNNETNKLRVVMRREQVLKICLNHALTQEITYKPKDEKSWLFAVNDFSEGELSLEQLCLRFQNKDVALQFKEAIDNALDGKPITSTKPENRTKATTSDKKESESDDEVIFVSEIQASEDDKKKAKELMLPENFYAYKNKDPCKGCRGCKEDGVKKSSTEAIKAILTAPPVTSSPAAATTLAKTPAKSVFPAFQSPTNSMYGTPTAMEKSFDNSIFRTPLGSTGSNTKSTTPTTNNSDAANATDKENVFAQKPVAFGGIFSNFGEQKPLFGTSMSSPGTLFGGGHVQSASTNNSVIAPPKLSTVNTTADESQAPDAKSIFATAAAATKPAFGAVGTSTGASIFGTGLSTNNSLTAISTDKKEDSNVEVKSLFSSNVDKPLSIFSGSAQGSLFGPGSIGNQTKPFGSFSFGQMSTPQNDSKSIFSSNTNNPSSFWNTNANTEQKKPEISFSTASGDPSSFWTSNLNNVQTKPEVSISTVSIDNKDQGQKPKEMQPDTKEPVLKIDNSLTFADLSSGGSGFAVQKKVDFKWEGAGEPLFSAGQKASMADKNDSNAGDEAAGADEEYDPHYEPIVPLPEKIVVTTGEEDEEKVFGERCKLYRYDDKTREWKERGVGEMKILYHSQRNTYRLLLRREQVHKAVLNMLLFMEMELLPMKNSDRAWTWVGRNYAETQAGEQETLAVRFKSVNLANSFRDEIVQCTRKLQADAAKAIREEQDAKEKAVSTVAPLRLPKHLAEGARADSLLSAAALQANAATTFAAALPTSTLAVPMFTPAVPTSTPAVSMFTPAVPTSTPAVPTSTPAAPMFASAATTFASVAPSLAPAAPASAPAPAPGFNGAAEADSEHVQVEPDQHDHDENQDEDDENSYHEYYQDYDYNEDEEEGPYYSCCGEAVVRHGGDESTCEQAHIQVLFDQDMCAPRILVCEPETGEPLSDMLIHTDTIFQMNGDCCSWRGLDYTGDEPTEKSVTVKFYDSLSCMQFYDSCETSKSSLTYTSNEPES